MAFAYHLVLGEEITPLSIQCELMNPTVVRLLHQTVQSHAQMQFLLDLPLTALQTEAYNYRYTAKHNWLLQSCPLDPKWPKQTMYIGWLKP